MAGNEIAVFTEEEQSFKISDILYFKRPQYKALSNYYSSSYEHALNRVIKIFNPHFIFFIGGIVNVPNDYYKVALKKNVKIVHLLLVQDFFCSGLHAIIKDKDHLKSINHGFKYHLSKTLDQKKLHPIFYYLNFWLQQKRRKKNLLSLHKVLGSSNQQLSFYKTYGFKTDQIKKIPLFFDKARIDRLSISKGDYFILLAQNRIDKGIQVLHKILDKVNKNIPIKVMFMDDIQKKDYISHFPMIKKIISRSKIELISGKITNKNSAKLVANSFAVINPSLWASTTEFVLLEALGLEKPMIGFDVGIHKELIKNGYNGFICDSSNYIEMSERINSFYNKNSSYSTIVKNGKNLFNQLTSDENMIKILKRIFR